MEIILDKGIEDINHKDKWEITALHLACRKGQKEIVTYLSEYTKEEKS